MGVKTKDKPKLEFSNESKKKKPVDVSYMTGKKKSTTTGGENHS